MNEFEKDANIDLDDLKGEVQRQPNLYYKWGAKYAKAKANSFKQQEIFKLVKSELNAELSKTYAELDSKMRCNFIEYGFDKKPTEEAIKNWVIMQEDYKNKESIVNKKMLETVDIVANAIEEEETFEVAKIAMQHKKSSLEKEVDLYLYELHGDPKIDSRYRKTLLEDETNQINKDITSRMMERKIKN